MGSTDCLKGQRDRRIDISDANNLTTPLVIPAGRFFEKKVCAAYSGSERSLGDLAA